MATKWQLNRYSGLIGGGLILALFVCTNVHAALTCEKNELNSITKLAPEPTASALADEIMLASNSSPSSVAISKKLEIERQADASR